MHPVSYLQWRLCIIYLSSASLVPRPGNEANQAQDRAKFPEIRKFSSIVCCNRTHRKFSFSSSGMSCSFCPLISLMSNSMQLKI